MSLSFVNSIATQSRARALVPLCVGAGLYLFFLYLGDTRLQDPDSFWQVKIGQWILDHHAMPTTDFHSFARTGAPCRELPHAVRLADAAGATNILGPRTQPLRSNPGDPATCLLLTVRL